MQFSLRNKNKIDKTVRNVYLYPLKYIKLGKIYLIYRITDGAFVQKHHIKLFSLKYGIELMQLTHMRLKRELRQAVTRALEEGHGIALMQLTPNLNTLEIETWAAPSDKKSP